MKKIVYLFSVFLLFGCFGGYSPESKFYRLQVLENITPLSNEKVSIGVDLPELPEYADRPQIVSFVKDGSEINIDETNRWGDDLDIMLQNVVASDLRAYLPKADVKAKTSLLEKFRYVIAITVTKFEMLDDNEAYFEVLWSVKSGSSLNVIYKDKISLSQKIEGGYEEYVKAINDMIAQMSKQIAERIIKH